MVRVVVASLLGVLLASVAVASLASPRLASTRPTTGPTTTLAIGDSTLWHAEPELAARHPDWVIDARRGRLVSAMRPLLRAYIRTDGMPDQVVIALGTNGSRSWSRRDLRRLILEELGGRTRVVLVLPVRPDGAEAERDRKVRRYARWYQRLARDRPRTFVADWRRRVLQDPSLDPETGLSDLIYDGVHENGEPRGPEGPGTTVFADLIDAQVR